ncbi:MAG: hypothetical protein AAGM22_18630 [Acidobacteriota bacterium]
MTIKSLFRTAPTLLVVGLLLPSALAAQAWDPIPRLSPGARSAVGSGLDAAAFRGLEGCLAAYPAKSGTRYFAAAVDVSDPSGSRAPSPMAAVDYADAVRSAWGDRLRERDVVIVFSVANRATAVSAGPSWNRLGFEGEMVDLTIETSSYGDFARDGRYGAAVCQLAQDVERTLAGLAPGGVRSDSAAPVVPRADRPARRAGESAGLGCGWLFFALLAGGVFFFWNRRRKTARAKEKAEVDIEQWRQRLGAVADRLLQLESEHPLYFTATERWSGESLEADRRCARAVNRVYSLYSTAHELQQRAEAELATGEASDPGPYEEAWRLLNTEAIQLTGRDSARLTLADGDGDDDVYSGPSAGLLDATDAAYAEALESLGAVAEIESAFYAASERAEKAADAATEACRSRSELGLSTAHLLARLEPALEERRHVQAELMGDPLSASARLAALAETLEDVARIGEAGNQVARSLGSTTSEALEALGERIVTVRAEGLKLLEPGFDPDLQLDRGYRQRRDIEEAFQAGDEERAITEHARLGRGLEQLNQMIDASLAAREDLPRDADDLAADLEALGQRLPASTRILQQLRERYAPEAFADVSDNLEELDPVRAEITGGIESVRADHAEQRYLAALEDLETCRRLLGEGRALLDEIDKVSETLDGQRQEASSGLEALLEDRRPVRESSSQPGVATTLRERTAETLRRIEELEAQAREKRPHWPELASDVADVAADLDALKGRLERESAAHRRAADQGEGLGAELRTLEDEVRRESRDRHHVAEAVADAVSLLKSLEGQLEDPDVGGVDCLDTAEELRRRADWAREVWTSEIDVIRRATTELRAAEVKLRREEGRHYGHGVRPRFGEAQRLLQDAHRAAGDKAWDAVITGAHRASEAAERESRRARREAQDRELEQRRRLEAAERRRRARLAASVTQAALQTAASVAVHAAGQRGGGRPGGWRSAGTSQSGFGRRRTGGGGWGGPKRRRSGGGGW